MQESSLTLVLSGHLRRPQSADLRSFWRGFIELQRKLPADKLVRNIVVHSWNPELQSLADQVYAPRAHCHEAQTYFYSEFIQDIQPPDLFEHGLNRLESTWKNVSVQTVLGNARSRARAVALLDALPSEDAHGQVLITRWDLGQSGSKQVNQLVADAALPEEHLYLSYYSEVDEGYADMWLLAPWKIARHFSTLDQFILDSLTGRNRYLELFTRAGWPLSRKKSLRESAQSHPLGQRIHSRLLRSIRHIQKKATGNTFMQRVVRKLLGRPQRFLESPPLTAENSYVPHSSASKKIFPTFQALNIHALLKFFILSTGLREQTRFLTPEDFALVTQSGQLIHPQPFILLLWMDDAADHQAIRHLLANSPLPITAAYLMSATQVIQASYDNHGVLQFNTLQPASSAERDQLLCALDAAADLTDENLPLLIFSGMQQDLAGADWFFLNALFKYIAWSRTGYVGLNSERGGTPHLDFPDLELVRGHGAFSLRRAAGTSKGIRSFLTQNCTSLAELSSRAEQMLLEFPVITPDRKIF